MEHVTENIFRWEGKIERTEEERAAAKKRAVADINHLIETDPYLRKMKEQCDKEQAASKAKTAEV